MIISGLCNTLYNEFDVKAFLQTLHFSPHNLSECLPGTVFALFRWDKAVMGLWSHSWSYREGKIFGSVSSQQTFKQLEGGSCRRSRRDSDGVFCLFAGVCKEMRFVIETVLRNLELEILFDGQVFHLELTFS